MNNFFLNNLKSDIPASIVVFFVAIPLCLGIALASGAPLFSGIIAGIIGGVVVGLLSGSQIGVSGPAAGLAAIVLTAIRTLNGLFSEDNVLDNFGQSFRLGYANRQLKDQLREARDQISSARRDGVHAGVEAATKATRTVPAEHRRQRQRDRYIDE